MVNTEETASHNISYEDVLDDDRSPRIIVLDDEESIRSGCQKVLGAAGYDVDTAVDGAEGWDKLRENDYDLALVDLKMPGMDGMTILKRMQKFMPDVVAIVITGYASYETAVETVKTGAYDYIPKPFTSEELRNVVERGLERRFLQLANRHLRQQRERNLLTLTEERSRLLTVLNCMTDGVLVINRASQLVLYNPTALNWVLKDDLSGDSETDSAVALQDAVDDFDELVQLAESIKQDDDLDQQDLELEIEDERFIHAAAAAVRDDGDNRYLGTVIVLRDITERKEIEKMKTAFVRTVSHELRSPLSAVEGYLNILEDEQESEQAKNMLDRCMKRIGGLQQTINDLLDLSRLERGQVHRELRTHDLVEILDDIVELQKGSAQDRDIEIKFDTPERLPIVADKRELEEIFRNLVSNAVKYNKDEGTVQVTAGSDGDYVVVEVSDTGIGIDEEAQKNIFDEFYRVRGSETAKITGSGLGLSIVQRLVQEYRGNISVESTKGEGTTFRVRLPSRT